MCYLHKGSAVFAATVVVVTVLMSPGCSAAGPVTANPEGDRLCRVKLVTDTEPDMTSLDTILAGITRPDMTDEEKCMAVYRFVYEHRYWYPAATPREKGRYVYDPVLLINCYPALICQVDSGVTSALWAALGYDVRYWQLGGHTTGEVFYGGKWRNFDATLGRYKRDKDGSIGGVQISQRFYKPDKSYVPPYDDYEIGHRMDFTLRRGETFTRYWYPLAKTPDHWRPGGRRGIMPDKRPGHRRGLDAIMKRKPYRAETNGMGITNGEWLFSPDLSDAKWASLFWKTENVAADAAAKRLHPKTADAPAELVWRMRTSYTITGAWLEGNFRAAADDTMTIAVSTDNGDSWKELDPPKPGKREIPLTKHAAGTFGYLVRISMKGKPQSTGVGDLRFRTVVQLNPLSLPALKDGENHVRLFAGEQVETITIDPNFSTPAYREAIFSETNVVTAPEQLQEAWVRGLCAKEPDIPCELVYKVSAPGEIRQVRWGGRFRADTDCVNEMHYSTDGKQWRRQPWTYRWTKPDSPVPNLYIAVNETTKDVTGNTVFLKYRFQRPKPQKDRGVLHLVSALRIDVDYVPPGGVGAVPVEIAYCWAEAVGGKDVEKTHTERVTTLPHDWRITVDGNDKPLMKWVRMRLVSP